MTADRKNAPGILDIASMSTSDVAAMPAELLADMQADLEARQSALKKATTKLNAALKTKYDDKITEAYKEKGADTGAAHITDEDITINLSRTKTVSYDQAGLLAYLDTLPIVDARHLADFKVSVSETMYKGALPGIKAELDKHRTVKVGAAKIKFEQVED